MDRDEAYQMASKQGFEGYIFDRENDIKVGPIQHIRWTAEDGSQWYAEVSEVNGCESFTRWDDECQRWLDRIKAGE